MVVEYKRAINIYFIAAGAVCLVLSFVYSSSVVTLAGLGLLVCGGILSYVKDEDYSKNSVLRASAFSSTSTLNQLIRDLEFKGAAIYLPPRYLKDGTSNCVFLLKNKRIQLPMEHQLQNSSESSFVKKPEGIMLTPPGDDLVTLFEETLKTSFVKMDMEFFKIEVPKLLVEGLEIAKKFEVEIADNVIVVKIENSIYGEPWGSFSVDPSMSPFTGSPLCSAIACALTKTLGKPVIVLKEQVDDGGKVVVMEYSVLNDDEEGLRF